MLRKIAVFLLSLLTFGLMAAPSAFAVRDLIVFKTNVPLEIPGKVIGPGTYRIVDLNTADSNGPVEIQNSKGHALGAFLTEPVEREQPVSHTFLDLKKEANGPERLKYFIPGGSDFGYRFEYPAKAVTSARTATTGNTKTSG